MKIGLHLALDFEATEKGESWAVFSPERLYRYELWRRWGPGKVCVFIGLNPSTADEHLLPQRKIPEVKVDPQLSLF